MGCILPVRIYMRTICLIELTVAWQNSKPVSRKMHAFLQNAIIVALLYSGFYEPINQYPNFIYTKTQPYITPIVGFWVFFFGFFFFFLGGGGGEGGGGGGWFARYRN